VTPWHAIDAATLHGVCGICMAAVGARIAAADMRHPDTDRATLVIATRIEAKARHHGTPRHIRHIRMPKQKARNAGRPEHRD
jgi:hypothetical protein